MTPNRPTARRGAPALGVLASLSLFGFPGCSPAARQADAPPAPAETKVARETDGTSSPAAPESMPAGKAAPDFSLPTVAGGTAKLSDSAGKVRLVTFWSTTCIPCIKELPGLKTIYGAQKDRGFEILYLSPDPLEIQKPFLEKHQVPFPSMIADEKTLVAYGATELPKMALVDGGGRILKEYSGETPMDTLEADVKAALAQAG